VIELINNFFAGAFWFIVVIGLLVFLHESGHFLTAKAFGMRVEVFSLGFGKRLFGRRRGETDYRLSLVPLGGYVKLAGGEQLSGDESASLPPDFFLARPRWQRFLVLVMGATVNIIVAVALYAIGFMAGTEVPMPIAPVAQVVDEGSPGQLAGIEPGDRIVRMNGTPIESWDEVQRSLLRAGETEISFELERAGAPVLAVLTPTFGEGGIPRTGIHVRWAALVEKVDSQRPAGQGGMEPGDRIVAIGETEVFDFGEAREIISAAPGRELAITVERAGERVTLAITPAPTTLDDGSLVGRIGIAFQLPLETIRLAPLPAVRRAVVKAAREAGVLFAVLRNLVLQRMPFDTLSGPLQIASVTRSVAKRGLPLLGWMAFISLQLGILNLLPIPMLDGGHIFILLTEGVLRRELSVQVKEKLHLIGFIFLLVLMAAVVWQDLRRFFPEAG